MSKLDDICYHMYESSGKSKYKLAGRNDIHPDEAKRLIKELFLNMIEAKNKEILTRYEDEADNDTKAMNAQHDYVRFHLNELREEVEAL